MSFQRLTARRIADGTTAEVYPGRITLENGIIKRVERGDFPRIQTENELFIDENKLLCPAFIDAHGHSDISLFAMKNATGKTAQGIAFEISGNCGLSPFPLTAHNREHLQELYRNYKVDLSWQDHSSYIRALERVSPALELVAQVGHNTLRASVAGYEKKHLSAGELSCMCTILDRELASGAVGLSAGLLYVPGCFAKIDEMIELMKVVARHNKIFTIHLRSEGNDLENSLAETLDAARRAGLKKVHLSHLKTSGAKNFHKITAISEALASEDIQVTGDVYCYNASMTQLSVILPAPFDEYDDVRLMKELQDPVIFTRILQQLQQERPADYWQNVRIVSAPHKYSQFNGKLLTEAACSAQIPPAELYLKILALDAPAAMGAFHTLSQENMEFLAAHPNVVPGSDESARDLTCAFGSSHPRGFGNHAEYFALRKKQGADLPQTVAEMSRNIADIFNLSDLGSITVGKRAVFTVIDPDNYQSTATFSQPHSLAKGAEILRYTR